MPIKNWKEELKINVINDNYLANQLLHDLINAVIDINTTVNQLTNDIQNLSYTTLSPIVEQVGKEFSHKFNQRITSWNTILNPKQQTIWTDYVNTMKSTVWNSYHPNVTPPYVMDWRLVLLEISIDFDINRLKNIDWDNLPDALVQYPNLYHYLELCHHINTKLANIITVF